MGKKRTKSIIAWDEAGTCYICGKRCRTVVHHMLHGRPYRHLADQYGLVCHLCPQCHSELHGKDGHPIDLKLQQMAQRAFEQRYGHEKFMEVFGKSWILDEEEK